MALTTYEEIKSEILENLEQFTATPYPEDLLREYADGLVPVYYHEIIEEWTALPMEECDEWKQYGMDESFIEGGITKLMQIDLLIHYEIQYQRAYDEIKRERGLAE
jgi:hypothetical protein